MSVRILLADDHIVVRQALRSMLEEEGFVVVAEAGNGAEAIRLADQFHPDVALLDLAMPELNGLEASAQIVERSPRTRTIILTAHSEDQYVLQALRSGASGYVLKSRPATGLVEAIKEVHAGNLYLSPGVSRSVVEAFLGKIDLAGDPLNSRERQVLQLIAEGNSSKQIAGLIGLSPKSVESYRTRIMQKLNIHETASLVRYAIRRGLIQP